MTHERLLPLFLKYNIFIKKTDMITKKCTRCEIEKDLEEFDLNYNGKYGRSGSCKICRREADRLKKERVRNKVSQLAACEEPWQKKGAEEILTTLGYELYNDDNPVYLQFKKRLEEKGIYLSFD